MKIKFKIIGPKRKQLVTGFKGQVSIHPQSYTGKDSSIVLPKGY